MSSVESLHSLETVILLLLVMVAVFAVVAHKLKVPYPIVLVLAGLAISFMPRMPHIPLEPSLVFLIFLPPLLFSSAWNASWRDFRHNLLLIGLLAFGLVGFTVWGMAEFSDRFITALDWKAGFLLGAVISTTDAIAATSIAKQIGLPRRIVDILEGESLLNDATGLLALEIGLSIIARGEMPSVGEGLARLVYLVVGGIGIGLLIGVVVAWMERFIDDGPVEMVVSLIVPYAAYLAGEHAKASGVLAVVACGLYLSRKSATFFSPAVRLQVSGAWEALTFVLNGLVFVLIGLQLPYVIAAIHGKYGMGTLVKYGAIFSVMVIALRMIWVYPAVKIAALVRRWMGHEEKELDRRSIFVIGWTGMRGVLALAAAISVPESGEWAAVWAAEFDFVSVVLRDSGDAGVAGADAAVADSCAGAGGDSGYRSGGEGGAEDCFSGGDPVSGTGENGLRRGAYACLRRPAGPVQAQVGARCRRA